MQMHDQLHCLALFAGTCLGSPSAGAEQLLAQPTKCRKQKAECLQSKASLNSQKALASEHSRTG